jgi:hypothetical protein
MLPEAFHHPYVAQRDIPVIPGFRYRDGRVNIDYLQQMLSSDLAQKALYAHIALYALEKPHVAAERNLKKSRVILNPDPLARKQYQEQTLRGRTIIEFASLVTLVKGRITIQTAEGFVDRDRYEIIHEHVVTNYDDADSCRGAQILTGKECQGIYVLQLDEGQNNQALFVKDKSKDHMTFASHVVHELLDKGTIRTSDHATFDEGQVDTFIITNIHNTILAAYDISKVSEFPLERTHEVDSRLLINPEEIASHMTCYYQQTSV